MEDRHIIPIESGLDAARLFGGGPDLDRILAAIDRAVGDYENLCPMTQEGRNARLSLARKVVRSKTFLDKMGKDYVAGWKAKAKAVDAERRRLRRHLDRLAQDIKRPMLEWQIAQRREEMREAIEAEAWAENEQWEADREASRKFRLAARRQAARAIAATGGVGEADAMKIVNAIDGGLIPHVVMRYE